jgi:hypothetical protein
LTLGEYSRLEDAMGYPRFSFKSEALWLLWLTLVPAALVLILALLVPWLRRTFGW